MDQTFKYLTQNDKDIAWGIYANVSGYAVIKSDELYPPIGHPDDYSFGWEQGRVLNEYQLLYITKGAGVYETPHTTFRVNEGDVILVFPYEWHRYRPEKSRGWTEYYVGFNGDIADRIISFFDSKNPVLYIGFNDDIYGAFKTIIQLSIEEKVGYQYAVGGQIIYLLGLLKHILLNKNYGNTEIEKVINQSRIYMRTHLTDDFRMEDLAKDLHVGYSLFRIEFKKYTGVSPRQYLLQLKIQRAKNLLANAIFPIKEVAYRSGFESSYYFSRAFRKYVGQSPSDYRKGITLKATIGL
ncbi:AraC family transcriptional regulator [Halosquirtibacter xylanolyticus]|uniref:AraC family transcriptional regulator n=1 Tax=Halosquirtibacter xylanolyticus TaxID=3374599 RepID=UPI0037494C5E|nr:AraC family transcriptional regulator [Prolixibacteraceae bacterium]